MRIISTIIIVLIIAFFMLPILNSNQAILPTSFTSYQIGYFVKGIFTYWIEVIKIIKM